MADVVTALFVAMTSEHGLIVAGSSLNFDPKLHELRHGQGIQATEVGK